ncbi:MAG TPA: hypothetical protein PKE30_01555 [Niabella sp.]|nr:hypothetical protein [Niabella sp.]
MNVFASIKLLPVNDWSGVQPITYSGDIVLLHYFRAKNLLKMNRSQWFAVTGIILLVAACFLPWMRIEDPAITITGIDTTGTRYGKPGYAHFIWAACILLCTLIPKIWAKRMNLLFGAVNFAWAIRNFGVLPQCEGGICPEKLSGLYLVLAASAILLITTLFPKEPQIKNEDLAG